MTIDQAGLNNNAYVYQGVFAGGGSTDDEATIIQLGGDNNEAEIDQGATGATSSNSDAQITQDGSLQLRRTRSRPAMTTPRDGRQDGDLNDARIFQSGLRRRRDQPGHRAGRRLQHGHHRPVRGDENTAFILQDGSTNTGLIEQIGNRNKAVSGETPRHARPATTTRR